MVFLTFSLLEYEKILKKKTHIFFLFFKLNNFLKKVRLCYFVILDQFLAIF